MITTQRAHEIKISEKTFSFQKFADRIFEIKTKMGTSKVGAIPERLKSAKFSKYAQDVFHAKLRNSFKTPKGWLRARKTLQKFTYSLLSK